MWKGESMWILICIKEKYRFFSQTFSVNNGWMDVNKYTRQSFETDQSQNESSYEMAKMKTKYSLIISLHTMKEQRLHRGNGDIVLDWLALYATSVILCFHLSEWWSPVSEQVCLFEQWQLSECFRETSL